MGRNAPPPCQWGPCARERRARGAGLSRAVGGKGVALATFPPAPRGRGGRGGGGPLQKKRLTTSPPYYFVLPPT